MTQHISVISSEADLTDRYIHLERLDSTLFPGISSSVGVHSGFRDGHAKSATVILSAVESAMSAYNATHVTIVGHSLGGVRLARFREHSAHILYTGAALALLDSVFLPLHLPPDTTFKTVGYGMPRVRHVL